MPALTLGLYGKTRKYAALSAPGHLPVTFRLPLNSLLWVSPYPPARSGGAKGILGVITQHSVTHPHFC